MLNEKSDSSLFYNCLDTMKQDLVSGNEVREALALSTLGNIGSPYLAQELAPAVIHKTLSENRSCPLYVKKKACMCLLSFLRREKQIYDKDLWVQGLHGLLKSTNYGLLLSACSLMKGTIKMFGHEGFESLVPQLVIILSHIQEYAQDYYYYMTPCPWLQVKILQIIQLFPPPPTNSQLLNDINS